MLVRTMAPDLDPEAELAFATRASASQLMCPFCAGELRPTRFGDVPLDRCERDTGLWLDADELQRTLHAIGLRYAERESELSAQVTVAGVRVYRTSGQAPDRDPWVPEAEPDRTGVLDLLRRLVGLPKKLEP
ncbi:MAG TPA: zf-TFIIB domain-containing protein [Kofleriaceae bacterium]